MSQESQVLPLRSQVAQYWIHDVESIGALSITYRAEEMRLNQRVWLQEFFPADTARRHITSEDVYTVYAHPTDREAFDAAKTVFASVQGLFASLEHPALPVLIKNFEASGTHYAAYRYRDDLKPLALRLQSGRALSEEKVTQLARSLLGALERLYERGIQPKTLDIDTVWIGRDGSGLFPGTTEWEPQTVDMVEMIARLGIVLHAALTGIVSDAGSAPSPLEPSPQCSAAICGLINRMISDDLTVRPGRFSEVMALLGSCRAEPGKPLPETCVERPDVKAKFSRLAMLATVLGFGVYMLFLQPRQLEGDDIGLFNTMRFHLLGHLGSVESQRALGQMYENGSYVAKDSAEALYWYKKAAEQGNIYAQQSLGMFYLKGIGTPKNAEKAAEWYYRAAEQGNGSAQYNMGYLYAEGIGVKKDRDEAILWYRKAAAQGVSGANRSLAELYTETGDLNKAADLYTQLPSQGSFYAQNRAAYLLVFGDGKRDYVRGHALFLDSAKKGNAYAQAALGYMYEHGLGIDVNFVEAIQWYRKAVENGRLEDLYRIGYIYEIRLNDDTLAMQWYRKAADREDARAQYRLGRIYDKRTKQYMAAITWYSRAADQGHAPAQNNLGLIYEKGKGTVKDTARARALYLAAAEQGNRFAQSNLGRLYNQGIGVKRDYREAVKWFKKAALQGHAKCQYRLGRAYELGRGVPASKSEAIRWYEQASSRGYFDATKRLKALTSLPVKRKPPAERKPSTVSASAVSAGSYYRTGYAHEMGQGVPKDDRRAIAAYHKAADLGHPKAPFRLAQLYARSPQIPHDFEAAVRWYKKAALEHDDALSYYRVSKLYRSGRGVEKNEQLAVEWCRKAAERNLGVAQSILGASYEFGWGVSVDFNQARYWYKRSLAQGYRNARDNLNRLESKL